ncbi:MAG: hypothetical protein Q7R96_05520 [Nanoarchaeota archaeon]|nr:hypothetical protein [Nanoarchaeota archaeon]
MTDTLEEHLDIAYYNSYSKEKGWGTEEIPFIVYNKKDGNIAIRLSEQDFAQVMPFWNRFLTHMPRVVDVCPDFGEQIGVGGCFLYVHNVTRMTEEPYFPLLGVSRRNDGIALTVGAPTL